MWRWTPVIDEGVGEPGGEQTRPEVLAIVPPPADDVEPLLQLVDDAGCPRIVLAVPVEGDDEVSESHVEAGGERGRLAEVRPQAHHAQSRQLGRQVAGRGRVASVEPSSTMMSSYGCPSSP